MVKWHLALVQDVRQLLMLAKMTGVLQFTLLPVDFRPLKYNMLGVLSVGVQD